ncbi:hypothetical protein [Devosia sp.]|uniref:hypothetical protein n=1 Tax=Devosia sp. TaxID=1871048 RepID=UPI001AD3A415|nr:hypothetical protein [Devosia sp.]MBN9331886.1 hypothetical protein [Devosia sp.]
MCEQCQAFGEADDRDALAAAFYSTYGKAVPAAKPVPHKHAPLDRQAPPVAAAPAKKAAP